MTAITVTLEASRTGVSVTFHPEPPPPQASGAGGHRDDAHPADDNPAVVIGPAQ
ncbi:MAG TPA: hypothetical protein VGG75_28160 [Trebonia sp.]|jgi:hypothetical protein